MKKEFKSEKNAYRFAATTTQEELAGRVSACDGMVCKFNDHVLVVNYCWCGFVAGVYKFIETPKKTGLSECVRSWKSFQVKLLSLVSGALAVNT